MVVVANDLIADVSHFCTRRALHPLHSSFKREI